MGKVSELLDYVWKNDGKKKATSNKSTKTPVKKEESILKKINWGK